MEELEIISREDAINSNLKYYYIGPCKNGHFSKKLVKNHLCVECHRINNIKSKVKNSEKIKEKNRLYALRTIDKKREYERKNKERTRILKKIYREKNKEQIKLKKSLYLKNNRDKANEKYRNRMENDHKFALKERIRSLIRQSLKKYSFKKNNKTSELLGCSIDHFKIHIEKQFKKDMTWENRHLWHIDHIIPLASAKTEDEIIKLNHYLNLRPLWANENLVKGDKMEFLI